MPEDQLPFAACLANHRRTIARLFGAQGAPELLAGVLLEGDRHGALAAGQANQFLAFEQRMPGETPHRGLGVEILLEIARPKDFSITRVEAEQISFGAEGKNLAVADQRGGARPGRVAHGVRTIVFIFPNDFSVGFIQAEHAFGAADDPLGEWIGRVAHALGKLAVADINPAIGNGRSGVTAADGSAPKNGRAIGGEFFHDARLAPNRVAIGAKPLRPIIGENGDDSHHRDAEPREGKSAFRAHTWILNGPFVRRHLKRCFGLVQKQLPNLAPLLPLPVRNERGEGRGEGRLLKCLNYASGSVLIFAETLSCRSRSILPVPPPAVRSLFSLPLPFRGAHAPPRVTIGAPPIVPPLPSDGRGPG